MNIFEKCKQIYEAVRYFTYGIPVDGKIQDVSGEEFAKNYRFLSPQEFVDLEGGVCWDYVEYERTCCENHGLKYHQYYIITDTPPNYDTHTFITVEDGDELIYIESSFKKVEHIIDGVKKFKSLEEIVNLITTTMFSCNGNDKRFDEIKYDVLEYHGHPAYGCTCEEYMNWMNENGEMALQGTAINPKNIDTDELNVESADILQEGLFNFGKPKEPVDVMAKLSETFGELSPAQRSIISTDKRSNIEHPFFEKYSKHMYENIAPMRGFLDRFLKKEKDILDSVNGVPEGSIPVGVINIIPNIDRLIDAYENYEDGVIDYDEYYTKLIDDPDEDLSFTRLYADKDGNIYTCLSQDGEYKLIEKSIDEFINKYQTYKFNLNKNEFTINRYYNSRNGIDNFSDPYNARDTKFHTTYKLDSNDIITVGFFYDRFVNSQTSCTFNPEAAGDDEPTDFPITYDSYRRVEAECIEHGVDKPFYPKMKVIGLTFHKTEESSNSVFLSNLTYIFALNESLDKPFVTVDVKNGEVTDIKFNDTIKESYEDDEEYDETLHDHIADEDDIYNESCVRRGRNLADPDDVMPVSGKSKEELEQELAKYIKTVKKDDEESVNESPILISNEEFFMEASKNPDIKARKRTVNNLRKLGVDRAHEVDNKKLEEGIDINIKDSYGNNHKVKFTSTDKNTNSYSPAKDTINITPETMNRTRFDATFNHEAGHVEQHRRFGLREEDINRTDYTASNKDDYPIKCAKLFLQKNKSKMNDHDNQWTELHADFLSCKKSGFGKAIKMVHTFRKSTNVIASLINECEKEHEEDSNKIRNKYLKINNKEGNERVLSDTEVEDLIASYKQTEEKLKKREKIFHERYINIRNKYDNLLDNFDLSEEYMKKFDKLLGKLRKIDSNAQKKTWDIDIDFEKKHGVYVEDLSKYKDEILDEMNDYLKKLRSYKALTTTYDYRAKFIEDMYWIHKGHPGRCSMTYPPMTSEDKKYMQEADCILVSNDEFFEEGDM